LSPDHDRIGHLIAEMGLEKFLEVTGEKCAMIGATCQSSDTNAKRHFQMQWEGIGENLRGLARKARSAMIGAPFVPSK
jgi:hypothetical protein